MVNKSNIFGYVLTEIYQFVYVLYVFALFAFHVHVAVGTLGTPAGRSPPGWYGMVYVVVYVVYIVVVYIIVFGPGPGPMGPMGLGLAHVMGMGSCQEPRPIIWAIGHIIYTTTIYTTAINVRCLLHVRCGTQAQAT